MFEGFDWDVIERSLPYLFRDGMVFTLTLTGMAMTGGVVFGTLLAMMRLSAFRPLAMLTHYANLRSTEPKLRQLLGEFPFVSYAHALGLERP